jgi:hypothetical protein
LLSATKGTVITFQHGCVFAKAADAREGSVAGSGGPLYP